MKALAILLGLVLASSAIADGVGALVLDHAMLLSMARTREPEVRIGYTDDRVEFRTRRSVLAVGWVDVLLTARFERDGKKIQLIAQGLRTGPIKQNGKRLEQARAGLLRLVNVETDATRVEIYKAGKLVYSQDGLAP